VGSDLESPRNIELSEEALKKHAKRVFWLTNAILFVRYELFHRYRFSEVAGLVDVGAAHGGHMVSEHL